MRQLVSLLKACLVAAAVFAIAWIRLPHLASSLEVALRSFVGFGLLITILSMIIGLPLILIIEWLRIGWAWLYTLVAGSIGAFFMGAAGYPLQGEIQNPFALTFSPWTRDSPGFAGIDPPLSMSDFVGSVVFGAIVGSALGLSFWCFYSRSKRNVV